MSYFVFAGGGTGGHLFPALAVVEKLRGATSPDEVAFFCTGKQIDADILGKAGVRAMPLTVRPFPTRPWQWPGFYLRWRESVRVCRTHFQQKRPAAVIGAGGYASGPPVHAALQMGIPTFILNPDAVPGRANRHMAGKSGVSGIFAQWGVTREHFPAHSPVQVTGCPVRSSFLAAIGSPHAGSAPVTDRAELARSFGLDPARPVMLVTGASQGARTINDALLELAAPIAAAGWQVLHLAGAADSERVRAAYAASGTPAAVLAFTDKMAHAMLLSDLIISRAGASSLAEILAVGKPSILLPYPFHRDQHQRHNAQVLVEAGAAILLDDTKDGSKNAENLRPILASLLTDTARREVMSRAALGLARPDSADCIASILRSAADPSHRSTRSSNAAVVRAA